MKFTEKDVTHFYGEEEGKTGRIRPGYYEYHCFPFGLKKWNEILSRIKNEPQVKKYWNRLPDNLIPFLTVAEKKKIFSIGDPNDIFFEADVDYENFTDEEEKKHNRLLTDWIVDTANHLLENPEDRQEQEIDYEDGE